MPAKTKFSNSQLQKAMKKVYRQYRHRANFTGADIGYLWDGDTKTNQKVVRVHVNAKIPLAEVNPTDVFPEEVDGIPLDVIEGPYKHQKTTGSPRQRVPVLMGGVSVGRNDNGAGTLGALVVDKRTGRAGVLSNWHVMAGPNADHGDPIRQPGRADGGGRRDEIATLTSWVLGLDGDAAVAELNLNRPWLPTQFNSNILFDGSRKSRLNEVLVKQGRTTGTTKARVDGEGIYRVHYNIAPGIVEPRDIEGFKLVPEDAENVDDIEVSEAGDSGSVWYNANDKNAVGLHFAGEQETDPSAERAIACNIPTVLDRLGVRLAGMSDLEEYVEALAETSKYGNSATNLEAVVELTPQPGWPCPPPGWPWPYPAPSRPVPVPQPRPRPWTDPRDFSAFDPRDFGNTNAGFGNVVQDAHYSVTADMWKRLRGALRAESQTFNSATFNSYLNEHFVGTDPAYEIARIIRYSGWFVDVIPPRQYPKGPFFEECVTFHHVCKNLANYIN